MSICYGYNTVDVHQDSFEKLKKIEIWASTIEASNTSSDLSYKDIKILEITDFTKEIDERITYKTWIIYSHSPLSERKEGEDRARIYSHPKGVGYEIVLEHYFFKSINWIKNNPDTGILQIGIH